MPSRSEVSVFSSGPALLPTDVLERASEALVNYQDTGMGLAELSHRSGQAATIINEAKADLATYLDIPENYEVLFMQGGGSGEFAATMYNLVGSWVARKSQAVAGGKTDKEVLADPTAMQELRNTVQRQLKVDYLVTGSWSSKAAGEAARLLGDEYVNVASDARQANDGKFGVIPDESTWKLSDDAAMVYYCDNETVDGVEFPAFPKCLEPRADGSGPIVVADMSSNILSRRVPVRNYGAIFFGAQKNLGCTGITVVVVRKDLLAQPSPAMLRQLGLPIAPVVFSYETAAKNNSLYNTLSIFDVYVAGQVLKKLLATYPQDRVAGQEAVADKKARLLYGALEAHPDVYRIVPHKDARSRMNICFRVIKGGDVDAAEKAFIKESSAQNLLGLKGHRSVGGIRACNFNTVTEEAMEKLVTFIVKFAKE